jgi:hypothetical protein
MLTAEDTLLRDEDDEKTKPWLTYVLAAFAIFVGIYSVKWGFQSLTWIEARTAAGANPWLATTPQPLPPPSQPLAPLPAPTPPPATGKKGAAARNAAADKNAPALIKLYNFQFTPPWPGKYKIEPSPTGNYTTLRFESGQLLVFYNPESQLDSLAALKQSDPANYQKFAAIFSGSPIENNYALFNAVYGAAPSAASPFMDGLDAERLHTLLGWKLAFGPDLTESGPFHSFDYGAIKGFQFGEPANEKPVAVRAFDDKNRQFRYIFVVSGGANAVITQEQIDTAVGTLKPVPFLDR